MIAGWQSCWPARAGCPAELVRLPKPDDALWRLFVIFLVAAFAETNRTPFDLPEAEQELAGGYNVEYSSIKFALFFMGEYANMIARLGHDGDAVLRRLDAAVVRPGPTGDDAPGRRAAHRHLPGEDVRVPGDVHLGALDVAALPLRSVDGPGLAAVHPAGAGEHCGHGGRGFGAERHR